MSAYAFLDLADKQISARRKARQRAAETCAARWGRIALTEITRVVLAAERRARSSGGTTVGKVIMTQSATNDGSLVPRGTEVANIGSAAQEDAGFDKILKFKKGEYFIGEDKIPLGTDFIAHAIGWTKCWIKFVNGERVQHMAYRVALGEKPPQRESLDDFDESKWPEGLDGKPADPWVYQYLLPLENPANGEVVIFVTSSFGGRRAVADLCAAYARRTQKVKNAGQPIVKLAKADMPTKKFGKVPRPCFEITGWNETAGDVEIIPPVSSKDEFRDEIPF